METTITSTSTDFNSKYADMISEKNFYGLLLKVKTEMRKLVKKEAKEFLNLLVWSIKILSDNNEGESSNTLMIYAIDEYDKNFNKNDQELCLEKFKEALQNLSDKFDKSKVKHRLLKFFEAKNIGDVSVQSYDYYSLFAKDSLKNNELTEGLRYALKSGNFEIINGFNENFIKNNSKSDAESAFFKARLTIELILIQNLSIAYKFISQFVDTNNNLINNHPILNFAFLLTAFFCKDASNFDVFWTLLNLYKPVIDLDTTLVKYLNKMSLGYFNKAILQEEGGMNIMNLLRAFSG
jgi:hypothetical protein